VLAADATTTAVLTGRLRWLVLAGVWVGLAFETKMLQAWLMVPALFVTYLVAGAPGLRRRLGHVALAGGAALVVSMSWMSLVAAVPAHDRPYVDGTTDDSVFAQVFVYNGWTRLGIHIDADKAIQKPQPFLAASVEANPQVGTLAIKASPDRLLVGPLGRDDGWLLPVALLSAVGILVARRAAPRTDPIRAGAILWGCWLVILLITFSKTTPLNSYYTAALRPAIAALCATGLALCWRSRTSGRTSRIILMIAVPLTTLYGIALVPGSSGEAWWLIPLAGLVCVIAEVALFASVREPAPGDAARSAVAVAVAALSILVLPAVTTGVVVVYGLGSFSTPYQSTAANEGTTILPERYQSKGSSLDRYYDHLRPGSGIVAVVDSTALAAPLIMVTGREFLPIGGYQGGNPSPTLARLQHLVATGQARYFQVPELPPGTDPRVGWVRAHCHQMYSEPDTTEVLLEFYDCSRGPGPD
jgi:4-amino-4-deoxy-L-arabinose transferase-like glycosyltransferase